MIGFMTGEIVKRVGANGPSPVNLPSVELKSLKYGYANARVRGMKSLLLKMTHLDELIKVKSLAAMIELLERTTYKEEFVSLSIKHRGSKLIELATARNFANIVRKIKKLTPRRDLPVITALLRRWDVLDLKTLLTAKRAGKSFEDISPYLLLVGDMSVSDFERIARAEPQHVLEEVKKTRLGKDILAQKMRSINKSMMDAFKKSVLNSDTLFQIQTLLDSYMYSFIDNSLSINNKDAQSVRRVFKKEIDSKNIIIIERLKARKIDRKEIRNYLISGGMLDNSAIDRLIESESITESMKIAKDKFRKLQLNSDDKISLSDFEINMEKVISSEKLRVFSRSILSVGVILGFILLKEEELHNIRKIAKAKEFNIPEDEIRKMLIVV